MFTKYKGYTLIELVIVIALIGLMAVFAIPAFAEYGRQSELSQKADEMKALVTLAHNLSLNPDSSQIKEYKIEIFCSTADPYSPDLNRIVLSKVDPVGGIPVKTVSIDKNQGMTSSRIDPENPVSIDFSTDRSKSALGLPSNLTLQSDGIYNLLVLNSKYQLVYRPDPFEIRVIKLP